APPKSRHVDSQARMPAPEGEDLREGRQQDDGRRQAGERGALGQPAPETRLETRGAAGEPRSPEGSGTPRQGKRRAGRERLQARHPVLPAAAKTLGASLGDIGQNRVAKG